MTVVVGVPLRPLVTGDLPPKLSLNRAYFDAIESAGAVALPIPIVPDAGRLRHLYELVDALILPGGVDVEPSRYGAVARSDCNLNVVPELDEVEFRLAEWAMADDLPLLGICRGIQVMNVACGGTLWQDVLVEGVVRTSHDQEPRDTLIHELDVTAGSRLAGILGTTRLRVNSLHHQAIRDLGDGLSAVARSSDGLVEGIELPSNQFAVGIQCHPEELVGKQDWAGRLFTALVAAANQRRDAHDRVVGAK
jgi:putative glutamine amidotransferase